MASQSYKVLIFLKRRAGLSLDAFREYYEGAHAPLCLKYTIGAKRYVRRYVTPLPDPETGVATELDFDVVTEIWFDDRTIFEKVVELAALGQMPPEILADEERLFDRAKSRFATAVECDSDLSEVGSG